MDSLIDGLENCDLSEFICVGILFFLLVRIEMLFKCVFLSIVLIVVCFFFCFVLYWDEVIFFRYIDGV